MKKTISLLTVFSFVAIVAACGGNGEGTGTETNTDTSTVIGGQGGSGTGGTTTIVTGTGGTDTSTSTSTSVGGMGGTTYTVTAPNGTTYTATSTAIGLETTSGMKYADSWCNPNNTGQMFILTGLWIATCAGIQWNVYITVSSDATPGFTGFMLKSSEVSMSTTATPSNAVFDGVAGSKCFFLKPRVSSGTNEAPTIVGTQINVVSNTAGTDWISGEILGGPCTITYQPGVYDDVKHCGTDNCMRCNHWVCP